MVDQPVADGVGNCLLPITQSQLAQNVAQVKLDRVLTYDQALRKRAIGAHASDEEREYLLLALGERSTRTVLASRRRLCKLAKKFLRKPWREGRLAERDALQCFEELAGLEVFEQVPLGAGLDRGK